MLCAEGRMGSKKQQLFVGEIVESGSDKYEVISATYERKNEGCHEQWWYELKRLGGNRWIWKTPYDLSYLSDHKIIEIVEERLWNL